MNSSVPFDFSVDNNHPDTAVIKTLLDAAQNGWKVKLIYHETRGKTGSTIAAKQITLLIKLKCWIKIWHHCLIIKISRKPLVMLLIPFTWLLINLN
jgi:hypothetical protein